MNVSKAASESGVSRNTIYRWNKQYIEHGEKGLEAKVRSKPRHSQRIAEMVEPVLALARAHPEWGCNKIAQELETLGMEASSPTIQKILIDLDLATQAERSSALEQDWGDGKIIPTAEQYRAMLKHNPCLGDRTYFKNAIGIQAVGVGVYPLKGFIGESLCRIVVVIDLSTLFVRCAVWQGARDRQGKRDLHEQTRKDIGLFRGSIKQPLHVVCTNKVAVGPSGFANLLNINYITISGGAERIGALRYFFRLMEDTFFPTIGNKLEMTDSDELSRRLQSWLADYNKNQKRRGFPAFGLTPEECKLQIKGHVSFCRSFPLYDVSV